MKVSHKLLLSSLSFLQKNISGQNRCFFVHVPCQDDSIQNQLMKLKADEEATLISRLAENVCVSYITLSASDIVNICNKNIAQLLNIEQPNKVVLCFSCGKRHRSKAQLEQHVKQSPQCNGQAPSVCSFVHIDGSLCNNSCSPNINLHSIEIPQSYLNGIELTSEQRFKFNDAKVWDRKKIIICSDPVIAIQFFKERFLGKTFAFNCRCDSGSVKRCTCYCDIYKSLDYTLWESVSCKRDQFCKIFNKDLQTEYLIIIHFDCRSSFVTDAFLNGGFRLNQYKLHGVSWLFVFSTLKENLVSLFNNVDQSSQVKKFLIF